MKSRTLLAILLAAGLPSALPVLAAEADDIVGVWVTENGRSHIEIVDDGEIYSGKLVWLKEPTYPADDEDGMAGQPKVDRENPDPSQRSRPILGLPLLTGFEFDSDTWNGKIYDPEKGKTYKCKATLDGDTLHVRGYIGFSLLGRTTQWTRLADEGQATAD